MNDEKQREQRLVEWVAFRLAAGMTKQAIRDAMVEEADGVSVSEEALCRVIEKGAAFNLTASKITQEDAKAQSLAYWQGIKSNLKTPLKQQVEAQKQIDLILSTQDSQAMSPEEYCRRMRIFVAHADASVDGGDLNEMDIDENGVDRITGKRIFDEMGNRVDDPEQ